MANTVSIWHTKAAFAGAGMHYIRFCQGLMAFFFTLDARSIDSTTFNSTKRSPNNR